MPPILFACGSNAGGQLGIGHRDDARTLAPTLTGQSSFPPSGHHIVHLAAGANHAACILRASNGENKIYITGRRSDVPAHPMALGGTDESFSLLTHEQVDSLLAEAGVQSTGPTPRWQPIDVACAWDTTLIALRPSRGGGDILMALSTPDEVGQGLAGPQAKQTGPLLVPLWDALHPAPPGQTLRIRALCAGPRHVLAHVSVHLGSRDWAHYVLGWGAARHGQLGPLHLPPKDQGGPRRGGARKFYSPPTSLTFWRCQQEHPVVSLAAGQAHTLILRSVPGHELRRCNALGIRVTGCEAHFDTSVANASDVGACWKTTAVLERSVKGDVVTMYGNGAHGQLGSRSAAKAFTRGEEVRMAEADLTPGTKIKHIRCGSEHVLVLVASAGNEEKPHVLCWGWNEHGNLGLGDEDRTGDVGLGKSDKDRLNDADGSEVGNRTDRWEPTEIPLPPGMIPFNCWAGCGTTYVLAVDDPSVSQGIERECALLPKVELHAHLHGSLRRRTVARWAAAEGQDASHAEIKVGDRRSLSAMFAVFDVLHHAVGGAMAEAVRDGAREVLEDMARQGVVYAELRTTPRILPGCSDEWTYLSTVARGLRDFLRIQSTWPVKLPARRLTPRLILSINRAYGPEAAERVVDLLLQARALPPSHPCTGFIIGLDVSGDPTKGSFKSFLPALRRAREAGIKITLHMAEVDGELGRRDTDDMLAFAPERVGHAIFLSEQQWITLCQKQIFSELCLTSNVFTQSVQSYHTHHAGAFLGLELWRGEASSLAPPPSAIATDDTTVFGSDLTSEYVHLLTAFPSVTLATARRMNRSALDASFLSLDEKAIIAELFDQT